jgi:hypothetical protein
MLRVGIIGCGNAGNQVAELAAKALAIPAIAINSSEKDLSTITIDKIAIGTQGSGKDRNIAKKYMKTNAGKLLDVNDPEGIAGMVDDRELVFVVSSTGGGSGSGIAPMLYDFLTKLYPAKSFILVGILPELRESIGSQQNTIEYLTEVNNIHGITYMLYDNNKRSNLPISEILNSINSDIVEDINIIQGYYQMTTPLNSIDEKDMFKIVNTPGMINISKVYDIKDKDVDNATIEDLLIGYIKNKSAMCEIERDGVVKRSGLIINLNPKLQRFIDKGLDKIKVIVGEALEWFEHDYINASDETNRAILILSGLSMPDDRITRITQRIDEVMESLATVKPSVIMNFVKGEMIKELRKEEDAVIGPSELDAEDIFAKYMKD